jgi:hypothetical protein
VGGIKEAHVGNISWERFLKNQEKLKGQGDQE